MPVFGLPLALESSLNSLVDLRPPTSWRVSGHGKQEVTVVVRWTLQVSSPSSDKTLHYEELDKLPPQPARLFSTAGVDNVPAATAVSFGAGVYGNGECYGSIHHDVHSYRQQRTCGVAHSGNSERDSQGDHPQCIWVNADGDGGSPICKKLRISSPYSLDRNPSDSSSNLTTTACNGGGSGENYAHTGSGRKLNKEAARSAFRAARFTSGSIGGDNVAAGSCDSGNRGVTFLNQVARLGNSGSRETSLTPKGFVSSRTKNKTRTTSGFHHIEARKMAAEFKGDSNYPCHTPKPVYVTSTGGMIPKHERNVFAFGPEVLPSSTPVIDTADVRAVSSTGSVTCRALVSQPHKVDNICVDSENDSRGGDCENAAQTDRNLRSFTENNHKSVRTQMKTQQHIFLPSSSRGRQQSVTARVRHPSSSSRGRQQSVTARVRHPSSSSKKDDRVSELRNGIRAYLAQCGSGDSEQQDHQGLLSNGYGEEDNDDDDDDDDDDVDSHGNGSKENCVTSFNDTEGAADVSRENHVKGVGLEVLDERSGKMVPKKILDTDAPTTGRRSRSASGESQSNTTVPQCKIIPDCELHTSFQKHYIATIERQMKHQLLNDVSVCSDDLNDVNSEVGNVEAPLRQAAEIGADRNGDEARENNMASQVRGSEGCCVDDRDSAMLSEDLENQQMKNGADEKDDTQNGETALDKSYPSDLYLETKEDDGLTSELPSRQLRRDSSCSNVGSRSSSVKEELPENVTSVNGILGDSEEQIITVSTSESTFCQDEISEVIELEELDTEVDNADVFVDDENTELKEQRLNNIMSTNQVEVEEDDQLVAVREGQGRENEVLLEDKTMDEGEEVLPGEEGGGSCRKNVLHLQREAIDKKNVLVEASSIADKDLQFEEDEIVVDAASQVEEEVVVDGVLHEEDEVVVDGVLPEEDEVVVDGVFHREEEDVVDGVLHEEEDEDVADAVSQKEDEDIVNTELQEEDDAVVDTVLQEKDEVVDAVLQEKDEVIDAALHEENEVVIAAISHEDTEETVVRKIKETNSGLQTSTSEVFEDNEQVKLGMNKESDGSVTQDVERTFSHDEKREKTQATELELTDTDEHLKMSNEFDESHTSVGPNAKDEDPSREVRRDSCGNEKDISPISVDDSNDDQLERNTDEGNIIILSPRDIDESCDGPLSTPESPDEKDREIVRRKEKNIVLEDSNNFQERENTQVITNGLHLNDNRDQSLHGVYNDSMEFCKSHMESNDYATEVMALHIENHKHRNRSKSPQQSIKSTSPNQSNELHQTIRLNSSPYPSPSKTCYVSTPRKHKSKKRKKEKRHKSPHTSPYDSSSHSPHRKTKSSKRSSSRYSPHDLQTDHMNQSAYRKERSSRNCSPRYSPYMSPNDSVNSSTPRKEKSSKRHSYRYTTHASPSEVSDRHLYTTEKDKIVPGEADEGSPNGSPRNVFQSFSDVLQSTSTIKRIPRSQNSPPPHSHRSPQRLTSGSKSYLRGSSPHYSSNIIHSTTPNQVSHYQPQLQSPSTLQESHNEAKGRESPHSSLNHGKEGHFVSSQKKTSQLLYHSSESSPSSYKSSKRPSPHCNNTTSSRQAQLVQNSDSYCHYGRPRPDEFNSTPELPQDFPQHRPHSDKSRKRHHRSLYTGSPKLHDENFHKYESRHAFSPHNSPTESRHHSPPKILSANKKALSLGSSSSSSIESKSGYSPDPNSRQCHLEADPSGESRERDPDVSPAAAPTDSPLGFACESFEHLPEGNDKISDSSSDEASLRPPTPVPDV